MPPLPVITDVWRTAWLWKISGISGAAVNVMHFLGPGLTDTTLFNKIDASVTAAMWDWTSGSAVVEAINVTALDGFAATHRHNTDLSAKWTGGGTGEPIPQAAGLVKLVSVIRGRSKRGRVYLPAVGEGEQNGGALIDVAAVTGAWETFRLDMAAAGATFVIASYKLATVQSVAQCVGEGRTATQRRRQKR